MFVKLIPFLQLESAIAHHDAILSLPATLRILTGHPVLAPPLPEPKICS